MSDARADIRALAEVHMSPDQVDALLGWIALRAGRAKALAPGDDPLARLEHAVAHWLSADQRARLADWLARRAADGRSLVPDHPTQGRSFP